MLVRRFEKNDAEEVSKLIIKTLRTTNIKDYSKAYIEKGVKILNAKNIIEKAHTRHFMWFVLMKKLLDVDL